MKQNLLYLGIALGLLVCTPHALAEDTEGDKPAAAAPAEENVVGKALKDIKKYVTSKKPNTKAKYYIYLESASWCGPCNQEMPQVVKAYKEFSKTKQVELILMSADKEAAAAKAFIKKYHGNMPCLLGGSPEAKAVPGFKQAPGIPHATVVDASGKVIKEGHGGIVAEWKSYINL